MTSPGKEPSAICTTQPAAAPHNLLLPAAGGFLGLAEDLVLHLIESAHRAVQCLEAVGVSSVPYGVPILHHPGWQRFKEERQKLDSAVLHPSTCQPIGTDCSRKPGVPRLILKSFLILSHAQNTTLWYSNSVCP